MLYIPKGSLSAGFLNTKVVRNLETRMWKLAAKISGSLACWIFEPFVAFSTVSIWDPSSRDICPKITGFGYISLKFFLWGKLRYPWTYPTDASVIYSFRYGYESVLESYTRHWSIKCRWSDLYEELLTSRSRCKSKGDTWRNKVGHVTMTGDWFEVWGQMTQEQMVEWKRMTHVRSSIPLEI